MAASTSASRAIAIPAVVVAIAQAARRDAAHRQHSKHGDDERDDNRRRRPNQTHHKCASFLADRHRGHAQKHIPESYSQYTLRRLVLGFKLAGDLFVLLVVIRHRTEDLEEHERRDDDGDHGPDAEAHFTQGQANELVEHAAHAPGETAHVADGDPEPLSRALLLADGAHRRKARRAQQVEGAEGDNRSGRSAKHLGKAVPELRVRLAEVAELGDDADGRDDVLPSQRGR